MYRENVVERPCFCFCFCFLLVAAEGLFGNLRLTHFILRKALHLLAENIDFENQGPTGSFASSKSLSVNFSNKPIFHLQKQTEQSFDPTDRLYLSESDEKSNFDEAIAEQYR